MANTVSMFAPLVPAAVPVAVGHPTAKRVMDVAFVVMGLLAIWPLLVMVALAIKLESRGPVFFVQSRVGKDGRLFGMVKFRSMVANAEALRDAVLASSDRDGLCFKAKDDPRITRVGRVLRRTSLDELPQLWNVLIGQMSLVGPRPALPAEVAAYPAAAMERLAVLPGITGLWQVSGRADVSFDDMVALDVDYVRNHGVRRDVQILWRTVGVVASGRGAY
jgi:lipopolysaccharide/colanic/teichoic acid biosynthesis glycosyltransferase